ncbi:MAG: hypothetical protein IPL39_21220 [Opitutaceae bacterium]|nr:hypothetical protein [Opitutaceae bacterium]
MISHVPSVAVPPGLGFKPGVVALCIRRGNLFVLVPRSWVRGMRELTPGAVTPLPRTKRWVLGLLEEGARPLPLLDPAGCVAATAPAPLAAVLLAAPEREPFALIGADGPGRFVSIPDGAYLEEETGWISRVQGGMKATWWLETGRLASELAG